MGLTRVETSQLGLLVGQNVLKKELNFFLTDMVRHLHRDEEVRLRALGIHVFDVCHHLNFFACLKTYRR
jgi:cupin superfamily acireductone dioxygenase involved in methionine salvage